MSSDGYTYHINVDTNGDKVLPKLVNDANKADVSLRKIGTGATKNMSGLNKTTKSVGVSLRNVGKNADVGFSRLEKRAKTTTSLLGKLRSVVTDVGLTLSTGLLASSTVGIGAGFEKSMSNVQALSHATANEMVSLKKAARQAGATTSFSVRESADAMGYLALAGYNAKQQIEALPATLNLAAAGSVDLARSADIATNILSQYRMNAKDTGVVVDQLAFTQSRFNTNIEEAADAMNYWGPTAAAMNISLSESNATIGLLANNGLKGSLATRALGTSIVRLSKPTKQMRAVMDSLNLSFFDSKGEFIGVAGMVEQLNSRMQGMTSQQKQAALSTIFGSEAIQEMNILLAEGSNKIRYWTSELDNAQGTAKRMADVKLDNLAGDFEIFKSSSQEVALSLYDEIGSSLRALTKEATLFVKSMDTKQVGLALNNLIVSLGNTLKFISENKEAIVSLTKMFIAYKATMLMFNKTQGLSIIGFGKAAKGANLLKKSIGMLGGLIRTNPIGLLLTALTAGISLYQMFKNRTKEVSLVTENNISTINRQRNKVRQLSDELSNSMTPLERRKEIINELRGIDAKLVEGLDAQNVSYAQLTANVERYNSEAIKRIMIERKQGEIKKMVSLAADAKEKEFEANDLYGRTIEKIRNKIRNSKQLNKNQKKIQLEKLTSGSFRENVGKYLMRNYKGGAANRVALNAAFERKGYKSFAYQDYYYDLKKSYADLVIARKNAKEAEKKSADFTKQTNKQIRGIAGTLSLHKPETNTKNENNKKFSFSSIGGESSKNIVSGGSRQVQVNITVPKFQDEINFIINNATDDFRSKVDEMRNIVNEEFMRIINSANQLVHQ